MLSAAALAASCLPKISKASPQNTIARVLYFYLHFKSSAMTLVLNFSGNANREQLSQLGEWLKEMGLEKSFKVALPSPEEPGTDDFIEEIFEEAEAGFAAGRTYTGDGCLSAKLPKYPTFTPQKSIMGLRQLLPAIN
ncbi:MAG: hypothetical protein R2830_01100 [Saprospiraceae bacterium]